MQVFTTSSGAGSDTTEHAGPGLGEVEDKMPPKMRKRWISGDALRMEVDDSGELSLRGYGGIILYLYCRSTSEVASDAA
jgi:hypothetical protein